MAQKKFYRTDLVRPEMPKIEGSQGIIRYYRKNAYGVDRMYLADKFVAAAVYDLTGIKTLLPMAKEALETLGFDLVGVLAPAKGEGSK